jgi:glycosyltransferase involved in cell wall biosynthesis
MHLVDSLDVGGTERMAVNFVNSLPRERYVPYLCTTRRDGPLEESVGADVVRLRLERKHRFDVVAVRRLVEFNREHGVRLLHAHSSSLFVAVAASGFAPHPAVVWHDHYGRYAVEQRNAFLFRQLVRNASGVIAVSEPLAEWARNRLHVPTERVWYIPNFVVPAPDSQPPILPGVRGARIVCVANLRPQKDHCTLLRAMALVVQRQPAAHLLLVGAANDAACLDFVKKEISQLELGANVSLLGERHDVAAILRVCDVGVLSSASEGLPLALIEYGMAGLPAVATEVGQCPEVLDQGRAGMLVAPGAARLLAEALLSLLESPDRRAALGLQLRTRVQGFYSSGTIIERACRVYETVLRQDRPRGIQLIC